MKDHKTEENKEIKKKQNTKEGPLLERGRSQQIQKPRPGPENQPKTNNNTNKKQVVILIYIWNVHSKIQYGGNRINFVLEK